MAELTPEFLGAVFNGRSKLIPAHGVELGQSADRVDYDGTAKHVMNAIGRQLGCCGTSLPDKRQEIRAAWDDAIGYAVFSGIQFLGGFDFPHDFEGL